MAQLNKVAFIAKFSGLFADNITGEISEADLRTFMQDITDSFANLIDTPAASAAFSSISGNASDNGSLVTYVATQISDLKNGVDTAGNTLKKLYDLIVALEGDVAALGDSLPITGGTITDGVTDNTTVIAPGQIVLTDEDDNILTLNATFLEDFQALVDAEIDAAVSGLYDDRGNYDASGNVFPSSGGSGSSGAILKGDIWTISVAGTLGGTSVIAGQTVRAKIDTPGSTSGNWAISVGSTEISNASTTVAGKVEKATSVEVAAGTSTGGTGAPLFAGPAEIKEITDLKLDKTGGTIDTESGYTVDLQTVGIRVEDPDGMYTQILSYTVELNDSNFSGKITSPNLTADRDYTLPDRSGEFAVVDDIPTAASEISNTPAGNIAATNVQAAINELDTEKEPVFSKNTAFNKNFDDDAGVQAGTNDDKPFSSLKNANWWTYVKGLAQTFSGIITFTKAINEAKWTDIPSATTTDLGAANGNYGDVTGTTTITGLGTIAAGARRTPTFTGILTLTHNATSLILPTGANIVTAAGDTATFLSRGSGNWKCVSYNRADGSALAISAMPALSVKGNATNATAAATDLQATTAERILARTASNTLAWIQATTNMLLDLAVTTAKIAANAVTLGKMAQLASNKVIGNLTGVPADPRAENVLDVSTALFKRVTSAINYTADATERVIGITDTSSARTVDLAPASSYIPGQVFWVVDESGAAGTNNITIAPNGSDTINGGTAISTNYGSRALYSDGATKFFNV